MNPPAKSTGIEPATAPTVGGKNVTLAMCLNFITGGFLTQDIQIFKAQTMTIAAMSTNVTKMKINM